MDTHTISIKDIMSAKPITATAKTPLFEVAKIITEHKFNGVPVVDDHNVLIGIITEHDLISGTSGIHLPTLQTVLSSLPVFNKDKAEFSKEVSDVLKLTAQDVMNADPLTLPNTASYDDVVKAFQSHHAVNPIPVIDSTRMLVGVVSRYDVLKPLLK